MTREIKFRAWNGYEMIYDVIVGRFGSFYVNPSNNGLDEKDSASLTQFNTKYPKTVPIMQYTGLNEGGVPDGRDIYFGDLMLAPSGNIFEVVWFDEEMRIALKHKDTIYNFNVPLYVIAGNVYENPELLNS